MNGYQYNEGEIMKIPPPPEHISSVLTQLAEAGYSAYLVGGCVRNAIMGRPVHDWDIATSATPIDLARLFPKTVQTGEKFGTVTVVLPECPVEVTTFRTESEYNDGRHPDNVEFVSNIDEDLSRRDFTINAIAQSADGELIDLFGGLQDIVDGVIRCVGGANTRFGEDALRMFRAFRFSAELGFTIEPETMGAICANADRAKLISADRIRVELAKTLMTQKPEIAGEMIKLGLLDRFVTVSGKSPEGLERIAELPVEENMRGCVFCAILLERGLITSVTEFLREMQLAGKAAKMALRALRITDFPKDRTAIKRLLAKHGPEIVRIAAAVSDVLDAGVPVAMSNKMVLLDDKATVLLQHGDMHSDEADNSEKSNALKLTDEIIASGECLHLGDLAISGSDLIELGHPPGKELGDMLNKLLNHVFEHPKDNTREALLKLAVTVHG